MKVEHKKFIDNSSYEVLLKQWRHAESGEPLLQGETGEYYSKVMFDKRYALSHDDQVAASKNVGWNR